MLLQLDEQFVLLTIVLGMMDVVKRRGPPERQPGHETRHTWRRSARRARPTSQQRNASPSRQHDSPCEGPAKHTTASHGLRDAFATRREPQWRACCPPGPSRCSLLRGQRRPRNHLDHGYAERDERAASAINPAAAAPANPAATAAAAAAAATTTASCRHGTQRAERGLGRPACQALVPVLLPRGAGRPPH